MNLTDEDIKLIRKYLESYLQETKWHHSPKNPQNATILEKGYPEAKEFDEVIAKIFDKEVKELQYLLEKLK